MICPSLTACRRQHTFHRSIGKPGLLLFGLVLLLAGRLPAYAQDGNPPEETGETIKVNVEFTVVDAVVMHKKTGRAVGALTADNFLLYEDGVRQKISSFSQDKLPLSIVFLFDLTDSVRPMLKPLAEGALDTLQHLKPEDEVAVMTYAASTTTLQDFTTDRALVVAAIEKASHMKSDEAAFFNEAIFQAAALGAKASNPGSRRVIIWLTDNVPNIPSEEIRERYGRSVPEGKLHTEKDAVKELLETGTVVCALLERSLLSDSYGQNVLFNSSSIYAIPRLLNPPGNVYRYAQQTGGLVVESSLKEITSRISDLIDQIRTRYSLGYHPSAPQPRGKFCNIALKLAPEVMKREGKLIVSTRFGYYR